MVLSLADILEGLTGVKHPDARLNISEAAVDSRQIIPGALFIPLPGGRTDGHEFVSDAFNRGASLAFINKDMPGSPFPIVDLRTGFSELSTLPSAPFCLRVNDALESLQKVAAFWRRKHNIRVIGITGSVGKSSTKN
jgi:UDP-N-acetylmuramoyl-tripeptide--D-alanyl-D-alanine ligase